MLKVVVTCSRFSYLSLIQQVAPVPDPGGRGARRRRLQRVEVENSLPLGRAGLVRLESGLAPYALHVLVVLPEVVEHTVVAGGADLGD